MLKHFFIYNPTFGRTEETEHEKLLYFYPPDITMDTKMTHVGLSEALVKYSSSFSPEKPIEVLYTQKTKRVYFNPEPNFWMSMIIELPKAERTKDGKQVMEYQEEEVQNLLIEALLQESYRMYKLFHGTFQRYPREELVPILSRYFNKYLPNLDLRNSDILDTFQGINFLPLDKRTYLRIQCFLNLLEESFACIKYTVFLFNEHLVWSGLEQDDMRVLYRHLVNSVLQPCAQAATTSPLTSPLRGVPAREGQFLVGPESLEPDAASNAPRVFVGSDERREQYLVVYQYSGSTVCMILDSTARQNPHFFRGMHEFASGSLEALEALLWDQMRRPAPPSDPFRFIYFNQMNLAVKASFSTTSRRGPAPSPGTPAVAPDLLRFVADVHADVSRGPHGEGDCEVIIKLRNDNWVVGRRSDQREFLVVLANKYASIIEVHEDIKRQSAIHFANIFFQD